jgi:formate dehydrogenase subunit delta
MSATTLERLVRMANQIAAEFENQQPGDAVAATWDHVRLFWDPRMKTQILAHLAAGGAGLSPISLAAIEMLRDRKAADAG